jgi:hypothetical protein
MAKGKKDTVLGPQAQGFISAARELGCDESEERFDAALKRVGQQKPVAEPKPKPRKRPAKAL